MLIAAASGASAGRPVRLGVAGDMSGPYAVFGGTGSVLAAQVAAEEFGGSILGRWIETLWGDTQNKSDMGLGFVGEWFWQGGMADSSLRIVGLVTNLTDLEALGTDDNAKVTAWLHEHPVDDVVARHAAVRPDGRLMNDLHVVQVKAPDEITDPLDTLRVLAKLPANTIYPGPAESACPLFRQASR